MVKVLRQILKEEEGVAQEVRVHFPKSELKVDRMEESGVKYIAHCGYNEFNPPQNENLEKYDSRTEIPGRLYICNDCLESLRGDGVSEVYEKIFTGELENYMWSTKLED